MKTNKKKYKVPELLMLNSNISYGVCHRTGSGDAGNCYDEGNSAGASCIEYGSNAQDCYDEGFSATIEYCDKNGSSPI